MKKSGWIVLLVAFLLICFTGCGGTDPVSETMVKEAVNNINLFKSLGMTVNSVSIDDQKTDTENKTDRIYVSVEAANEETACTVKYVLNYYLYDQGWSLESVSEHNSSEWEYRPLKAVAQSILNEKVQKAYGSRELELTDTKEDLENGSCIYTYSEKTELENCVRSCVIEVRYVYDFYNGAWKFDSNEEIETRLTDWDIVGTWDAVASNKSWMLSGWSEGYVVTIKSLGEDTAEMSIYHPEVGDFFDGTVPFDPNSGIEFFVNESELGSPDSFTIVISENGASLLGVGMMPNEGLKLR